VFADSEFFEFIKFSSRFRGSVRIIWCFFRALEINFGRRSSLEDKNSVAGERGRGIVVRVAEETLG